LKKNFYKILGVNKGADSSRIKKAYRRAAKRYHPDISPKGEERFKEIQEAYETLSDPGRKAIYDQEFINRPALQERFSYSPNVFRDPFSPTVGFDWLFDQLFDFEVWDFFDFFGGDKRGNGEVLEILLTPEEAREGGKISIPLPIWVGCSRCHNIGRVGGLICGRCRGKGKIKLEKEVEVTLPPEVDDSEVKIPVYVSDRKEIELTIKIKVSHY